MGGDKHFFIWQSTYKAKEQLKVIAQEKVTGQYCKTNSAKGSNVKNINL